jgi:uncharacterized protein (TIGR02452 family)
MESQSNNNDRKDSSNTSPQPSSINFEYDENKNNEEYFSVLLDSSRSERAMIADETLRIVQAGYYEKNNKNIAIGKDVNYCLENTRIYIEDIPKNVSKNPMVPKPVVIEIQHCTTLQAAESLWNQIKDLPGPPVVGVLNFASAKNPGGGFMDGSNAQEESLARSSCLYPAISQGKFMESFYSFNRKDKLCAYSNRIIYSPKTVIFRNDGGTLLENPYTVSVVTCPAPNAGVIRNRANDPAKLIVSSLGERIRRILFIHRANGEEYLVLGAFGCGVFKNDPYQVAQLFKLALNTEEFCYSFRKIIFAILDPPMVKAFAQVFSSKATTYEDKVVSFPKGKQTSKPREGKKKNFQKNDVHLKEDTTDDVFK